MEKEEEVVVQDTTTNQGVDYIGMVAELKKNSVPIEQYEQLAGEQKRLMEMLINGETVDVQKQEDLRTPDDIRKELFNPDREYSNLEYCKLSLELREAILREGGKDPFVADNQFITPTIESQASADRVADVLRQCIEYANGDSEVFTNELMRRTNDVALPNSRKR